MIAVGRCEVRQGDVSDLQLPESAFDLATAFETVYFWPGLEKCFAQALSVLKPGGLYILSDTGIGGIGAWIDNHILFKMMKSGDCHTTNRKGIEKMMVRAGFTIADSRQIRGMIYTVTGKKL
jgi:SAM-dependent methyltransferase